ncbi:MAG: ABC transporter substrate-binding protein [Sphaerochaetaceae bacterium]|jgi:sn-glycerol 3-phosphate transport system substrate-binding protein|nr:ABC transporter substrate-binding protein [Sphaerochaetaceae bacterium]NLO61442.1 ABC transporter substrate-binding protein [Spirochaetales bacterium]MDD2405481.1 ABC transporter substrate-binding protein [Sphaerochaetaceae bacterium]MDD3670441.1 ABC transporter substrate-binding protein [Sphaerochaetaceae bacterium]MDD4258572.1 ABC transporter substrate-binding protein [Sphaerochaetaceae bacterium]
MQNKLRGNAMILLIMVLLLTLFPLFSKGQGETKKTTMQEVVFWHSNSGLQQEAMTLLVQTFNDTIGRENSVVVREIYQGKAADVATKLRASLQSGRNKDLPDIAQLDATGVMDVRDSVFLVPASDLADADASFDFSQLQPGAVLSTTYKNKVIGMPFNCSTIVLYYNKDAFIEVGLDPQHPPRTLAELADYTGKLAKYSADGKSIERYGFAGIPTTYELVSWIGQQHGLSYMTDMANGHEGNPTRVVFDENDTMATFLTEWRKVYESGGLGNLSANIRQEFSAGKVAMHVASTSGLSTLLASIDGRFELGVGFFPKVNDQATGGVNIGGGALFAFDNGNDPGKKATWLFLKFLMNSESQFAWHKATGYFPVNLETYELPQFKEHVVENPLFQVAIDQLNASNPEIQSVWWPNAYQAYYEIQNRILEMLEQSLGVEQTVSSLASVLNQYMANYNRMNPSM